ncbi:MAG TPA: ABC transporter substrate-binding protein [Ardenticatenaceae bacterium]|nr:ABC transporter substrate-binding protein [Ardenticatenaceae bacterium]
MRMRRLWLAGIVIGALLVSGCRGAGPVASTPPTARTPVKVAMGFVPNVQFAPVYVAIARGYFAEEGLDVTLDYGMENDIVQLVGTNALQFAVASGDQVLLAREKGLPVVYVSTWFKRFPTALVSLALDLSDPRAVEGHSVGLPGLFGANYVGWLALAHAAGINTDEVRLESIGFNQVPVLVEGRVDAAMVYANNEPLQLAAQGHETISTAEVSDYINLVANGLITNETTIREQPELVQGMVRGLLRGLEETIARPEAAFDLVVAEFVPEAGGENAQIQRQVLEKTIEYWRTDSLGVTDPAAWQTSHDFMRTAGLLEQDVDINAAFTNRFVEAR